MPLDQNYNVLLITPQAVLNNGVIENNIDPAILVPAIRIAQDQWIQGVLGTPMLVYLQDGITNSTLTSNDTFLLQVYLEPSMVWYTTYEFTFFNAFKLKNKGLEKMSGENSQAASLSELESFQNHCKERAEFYAQRLLRYMEAYPQYYPAFNQGSVNIADLPPNRRTGYQSSMYLGDDKGYMGDRRGSGYGNWFFENY
jgi:hypothetical protein